MDPIRADSAMELLNTLKTIDISVPLRTEGRTKEHCERWSICQFLASFADSELLTYPLSLFHQDKPDFLLELGKSRAGIEVTEVIPEGAAKIAACREKNKIDGVFFRQRYLPGRTRLCGDDLKRLLRSDSPGSPWFGDSAERDWVSAMKNSIKKKVEKSQKSGFSLYERNWLLMYDNWPVPALNQDRAAKLLFESITPEECAPFEKVIIECSSRFWVFSQDDYYFRPKNDLWSDTLQCLALDANLAGCIRQ